MKSTKSVNARFILLVALTCVTLPGEVFGQDAAASEAPLRELSEVMEKLLNPSVGSFDIDLEASVTFWHPERHKLFVQDHRQAVYVQLLRDQWKVPDLRVGSRVRIVGHIDTMKCLLFANRVELLAQEAPPYPRQIKLDEIRKGEHWSHRVEMEGVVDTLVHGESSAEITIDQNGKRAVCTCLGSDLRSRTSEFFGARIRVIGVMDWEMHESGAPRTARCHIGRFSDIKVLSPPKSNESSMNVDNLTTACATATGSRIACNGIVTFVGEDDFLVEDEGGSLLVRSLGEGIITTDAQLRMEGRLQQDSGGIYLQLENSTESVNAQSPRGILRSTPRQIFDQKLNRCRISIEGTLVDHFSIGDSRTLSLEEQGIAYRICFNARDERFDELNLHPGQNVRCQGLLTQLPASEDGWFAVQASSVDDVWPSQDGPMISRQEVLWWLTGGSALLLIAITWSATLRAQVNRKTKHLAALTTRLNASYEAIDEGILLYNNEGTVLSCNRRFGDLTGLALTPGSPIDVLPRRLKAKFGLSDDEEALFKPSVVSGPTTVQLRSTSQPTQRLVAYLAPVQSSQGSPNATLLTLNDVTKQKELEAALVQSQKMEAVGQLAGGVAHDFNNLLMVIISNLDLARNYLPTDSPERDETLGAANQAAERAADLVKNLLGFSRLSELEIKTASLNTIAANVASLIRRSFDSSVRIETEFEPELQLTKVDPAQIEQVLMNVCLNARDALTNHSGRIRISTSNYTSDDVDYVKVSVEDDGVGMSKEVSSRIFEPFFTTKETDKGTGLGMSMSYGIVSQHGGWIECDSQVGKGTRVDVILPQSHDGLTEEDGHAVGTVDAVVSAPVAIAEQAGRVLVIDDDDAVRRSTCRLLESLGFDVEDVDNGVDGLRMLAVEAFNLLVLDLNMPVLSGQDVCTELARIQPQLPVIICTGHLTDNLVCDCPTDQTVAVLKKPFRIGDLKSAVAETLGAHVFS